MGRYKTYQCSVVACKKPHSSLHKLPASEDLKAKWIDFIYGGNVPVKIGKNLYVCTSHFTPACFSNYGQYNSGLANRLAMNPGSVPTVRPDPGDYDDPALAVVRPVGCHVACQTEQSKKCSVGTQLSIRTLQPHYRSSGTQTRVSTCDVGVGTSERAFASTEPLDTFTQSERPLKRPRLEEAEEEEEEEEEDPSEVSSISDIDDPRDATYDPADSSSPLSEPSEEKTEPSIPPHKTPTYLVYENCLLELFEVCPVCKQDSDVRTRHVGTFLSVEQQCPHCQYSRKWNSQPIHGSTPTGNLQLSAAVYTTGASFFKVEKVLGAMNLKMFKYDTFRRHARNFIEPAIVHFWKSSQDRLLEQLSQQQNVILGGASRADSPGNFAKFGNFTMMDLRSNTVVDVQLVQSNEVDGSRNMEKEGLKRSLAFLEERDVTLHGVVTKRRAPIQKVLTKSKIPHYCDAWHVEKGLSKKLVKISKSKDCEKLQKWLPSIKKHIYWTAASSSSGPERVAKWTSILNHVQDIHTHEDPLYPQCLHAPHLSKDEGEWLEKGSRAFRKLEKLLTGRKILKDVEKLSPHNQTSLLAAFHSTILRFAPKNVAFPFIGMLCRLYLAVLYFNENAGRPQATSSDGELLFKVSFPKSSKGRCTAKPVKTEPTFHYEDELLDLIFEKVFQDPAPYLEELQKIPVPEEMSAQYDRPEKMDVVDSYMSSFNMGRP